MSRWRLPRRNLAAIVLIAASAPLWPGRVGAATERAPVGRVLVLSLPGTTWEAIADARVPHLDALFRESAVGSTSVRTIRRTTYPGDGYVTIGAGAQAAGVAGVAGLAFDVGEAHPGGTASGPAGAVVSMAMDELARDARRRYRGAEIGALGDVLSRAGIIRGVIGNADRSATATEARAYHREVALGLADRAGVVPAGEVGRTLLRSDAAAPLGLRLERHAVVRAFREVWDVPGRAVVLVEASDLARLHARPRDEEGGPDRALARRTLESADELVGAVLAEVDPQHDAVIVTSPSDPGDGVHLTVAALRAPGVAPGILSSASTRRGGFVMLSDVAPTVLDLLGLERPSAMEGRPYRVGGPRRAPAAAVPVERFVEADDEARFRDRMLAPVAATYVTLQIVLSLVAALVLKVGHGPVRTWARRALAFVALWLMAVVPLTFLTAVLDLASVGPYLLLVMGGGAAVAVVAGLVARRLVPSERAGPHRGRLWPMAGLLGLLLLLQVGDVVTGSRLQLATVFGYSPTVGGRFSGFGNLAFGQVATAAILLAGILAHLLHRPWGFRAAAAVLAVTLVADGMPMWGSDVGGVLAAVPAFSLVALRLAGRTVSARRMATLGAGAVATVIGFGLLDLLRPAPQRTHLGRLFEQMGEDGVTPLTDAIIRKIGANLAVLPTSIWVPLVPSVLAFLAWLAWGRSARLEILRTRAPELRPALVGVLVAAVLGFALNDSGIAVPAMMLGVLNPVLVYLAVHWDEDSGVSGGALAPGTTGEPPGTEPQRRAVHEAGAELRVGEPRFP
ncbi:MAG TPA: hypothetical protein VEG38_09545 [Acidimicrobiia bacterium]|nr:hypothetical protein [Acidimicrobiia bacterium]